jgi:uncharacterized protein (DUF2236 family)
MPGNHDIAHGASGPWRSWGWLREELANAEDEGYFGPASAIWRVHREMVLGLGLGRALLMQLAHPWVAQAVSDHSTFRHAPLDRLFMTIAAAELLVFGSQAQANSVAAHIRAVHGRIKGTLDEDVGRWRRGTPYSAEDPDALLWVLVTSSDTALSIYQRCFGRLDDDMVRAYLEDAARVGAMVGVVPSSVPQDRLELERYIETMLADGTVAVGRHAHALAAALARPAVPWPERIISWPYRSATWSTTTMLLPAPLRAQYGPILDPRHPHLYRAGGLFGRSMLRRLSVRWRRDPIAGIAIDRVGRTRRDATRPPRAHYQPG